MPDIDIHRVELRLWDTAYSFKPNETLRSLAEQTRRYLGDIDKVEAERRSATEVRSLLQENAAGMFLVFWHAYRLRALSASRATADFSLRATRAILALRCRALETGELPESLDALVPDLLEAVPADPFDGKPLRYSKEKRIVWSVGEDLTNSGGQKWDAAMALWLPEFEDEPTFRLE